MLKFVLFYLTLTTFPNEERALESYKVVLPPIRDTGWASFYGAGERGMHGRITASGEVFNGDDQTCASRTLPLGSIIYVEDVATGHWTHCRVNDRGPYGARMAEEYGGGWAAVIPSKGKYKILRRSHGTWEAPVWATERPGTYRGILDMSYGTAKALGVNLDAGLNRIRIRYWGTSPRYGLSPRVYRIKSPVPQCQGNYPMCGSL